MDKNNEVIKAVKESVADTSIAMIINIPLNFALISLAFYYELSALETSLLVTTIFTIMALIRKTYIRLHFSKKYREIPAQSQ
jgi:O-antigen/teichoic acid export membrane protein